MNGIIVLFAMKLMFVTEIHESESGAVVQFEVGRSANLLKEDPQYSDSLERAREGLKEHCPVVVTIVTGGRAVKIGWADSDTVDYIKDFDAERFKVGFRGHAAFYYLRKDNPNLHRVKATLEQSAKGRSLIWLSIDVDPRKMLVVDALPMEHIAKKDPGTPKAATHTTTR